VIERFLPISDVVHNTSKRDSQLDSIRSLIRNMGKAGVKVLCYNWMPVSDWSRTNAFVKERGGSLVTEFNLAEYGQRTLKLAGQTAAKATTQDELWHNLEYFLTKIVPVAEEAGVHLAIHPDDPPMPSFGGQPQILFNFDALQRVVNLVKSPSNGICFCQGTFASAGLDVFEGIYRLAPAIRFIHFRDVRGQTPHFIETWQDNGKTNMVECMRAYYDNGLDVPLRPDHVPSMVGENNEQPGYHMLGRLFALGYIQGLKQAVETEIMLGTHVHQLHAISQSVP